jgi:hypothetical protein
VPILIFAVLLVASLAAAAPLQIVLVNPEAVTPAAVAQWKGEGFKAVAIVLDEDTAESANGAAARSISDGALDLYWWIEVARNPKLAEANPRWMAALGSHQDWQKRFPKFPEPGSGEVAKAFPWVPIIYRESFDAHLQRIDRLVKRVPAGWRGLLLNDLQGGPSSCGCGNTLCRWATDYYVPSTATKLEGDFVASRFVGEAGKRVGNKSIIPVWTTECDEVDLPSDKNKGRPGTGLCGTVGCATGACPETFARQWSALVSAHNGPVGLLGLHNALERTRNEFGGGPQWPTNAVAYVDRTLPAHSVKAIAHDRLWIVVEETAREAVSKADVGAVIVARTKIDQSYEPRIVSTK